MRFSVSYSASVTLSNDMRNSISNFCAKMYLSRSHGSIKGFWFGVEAVKCIRTKQSRGVWGHPPLENFT